MPFLAVIGTAFVITFLAELPDKSMFASLILATRYRPAWVWAGAAAAFTVQIGLAVTAALFVAGSAYLWVTSFRPQETEGADAARQGGGPDSFWRVAATSFGLIFLAEFGDITQITAANLAARYGPLPVFAGAALGLWAIAAVAVSVAAKSLKLLPLPWIRRATATILLGFGIYAIIAAITG